MTEQEWLACTNPVPMLEFLRGKNSHLFGSFFDNNQPGGMTKRLSSGNVGDRRLRLFASGCVRGVWNILEEHGRKVVEVSERYADGLANQTALETALAQARRYREAIPSFEEPGYLHYLGDVDNIGYWRCRRPLEESAAELVFVLGLGLEAETVAKKAVEAAAGLARADAWETGLLAGEDEAVNIPARDAKGDAAYQSRRVEELQAQATLLRDIFGNPFRPVTTDTSWLTAKARKLAQSIYSRRRFQDTPRLADALEEARCTNREILEHCRRPGPHVRGCWVIDLVLEKS
jgi:hypothetical protein